ncbi:transglutaminaseTgpA domain-containing protein [Microbacterium sp. 1P10AE]|uniref:transglutaminase family protein n=1 Tax=Microbacterium sp. 1P10AE TaxID=3132286 RepID=UPI0039A3D590
MSAADVYAPRPVRSRRDLALLSAGILAGITAALLPVFSVIAPGLWTAGALTGAAAVLASGLAVRVFRLPALLATGVQLVVGVVFLTAVFGRATALLGIIPTPATLSTVSTLFAGASEEIRLGVAPVVPSTGLAFVLVAAVTGLAVVLDHVVLTARMPLLAGVGLVAVSLIPTIAIPAAVDVPAVLALSAAILFLLRMDVRSRTRTVSPARRVRARVWGASATAIGIAAVAVLVTVVAVPILPQPGLRFASGTGAGFGTTINPNLELGNDLRQPRDIDVLTVTTTGPSAPYLRAVTLSQFDGAVWQPDAGDTVPVPGDAPVFDPVQVDGDIAVADWTTTVSVGELDSPWLPVPYPASTVTGLEGEWLGVPENRTIVSRSGSSRNQDYQAQTLVPRPTLEQIRSRPVGGSELGNAVRALPADIPPIIGETARSVTAGAQSPYDALIALQTWFRSSEFRYSLDAPVEAGFDGAGLDAVARFLQERAGYCVHFASAFAVMARTLDMPSRIVVGYLPGTRSGSVEQQGRIEYTVTSSQLHAWPEVYFRGIGWVPFEPTNSLGVPTSFASGTTGGSTNGTDTPDEQDAATPGATRTDAPQLDDQNGAGTAAAGSGAANGQNPVGVLLTLGGVVLLLLAATPGTLRAWRRRSRAALIREGDAVAAWTEIRAEAVDLGIRAPDAESPRAFAARLIELDVVDVDDIGVVREALERAIYAEDGGDRGSGPALADAVARIRARLRAGTSPGRRLLALVFPRSLTMRAEPASVEVPETVG